MADATPVSEKIDGSSLFAGGPRAWERGSARAAIAQALRWSSKWKADVRPADERTLSSSPIRNAGHLEGSPRYRSFRL